MLHLNKEKVKQCRFTLYDHDGVLNGAYFRSTMRVKMALMGAILPLKKRGDEYFYLKMIEVLVFFSFVIFVDQIRGLNFM
jgi:hypothetical protein